MRTGVIGSTNGADHQTCRLLMAKKKKNTQRITNWQKRPKSMKIPSGPTLGPIHFSPSSGPKAVVVHGAGPLIATAERGRAAEKSLMSCQPDLSSFLPHSRLATEKVGNIISFGCKLHVFRSRFQQFGLIPVAAPLTGSSSLIYDTALISVPRICVRIDPAAAVEPNLFFKKKENQWKNKNSIDDTFRLPVDCTGSNCISLGR
jgi:hypothetical protein